MKNLYIFLIGLCIALSVGQMPVSAQEPAQTTNVRITWPLNRTVLQRNASNNTTFRFSGQWVNGSDVFTQTQQLVSLRIP